MCESDFISSPTQHNQRTPTLKALMHSLCFSLPLSSVPKEDALTFFQLPHGSGCTVLSYLNRTCPQNETEQFKLNRANLMTNGRVVLLLDSYRKSPI